MITKLFSQFFGTVNIGALIFDFFAIVKHRLEKLQLSRELLYEYRIRKRHSKEN